MTSEPGDEDSSGDLMVRYGVHAEIEALGLELLEARRLPPH
jgi:hypothetical protein